MTKGGDDVGEAINVINIATNALARICISLNELGDYILNLDEFEDEVINIGDIKYAVQYPFSVTENYYEVRLQNRNSPIPYN